MNTVAVVGGGISGLACARTLLALSNDRLRVKLFEASNRLGGQIQTIKLPTPLIVEAGAEGFVARSKIFPRLAEMAGISQQEIVSQISIADNELSENPEDWRRLRITELEPGEAARKLGFQVPKEDRGRGIRSFRNGMGDLVNKLAQGLEISTESPATSVETVNDGLFRLSYVKEGTLRSFDANTVVLATPLSAMESILAPLGISQQVQRVDHNSHVSVHLLVKKLEGISPKSFTVSTELQPKLGGLRACSFLHDKFPGRCDPNNWLFRFYFRPQPDELLQESDKWVNLSRTALERVFGYSQTPLWHHFAPWFKALPVITPEHLNGCASLQAQLQKRFNGSLHICGSEVAGAGLDSAANSGHNVALRIVENIQVD